MVVWVVILASLAAAYLGLRKGLLFMFATLFNLMFAIFIAVLSTPLLLTTSPGMETSGYYAAGCVLAMFVLIFGILEGFGWFFFLRDSEDYFPKLLDKVGGVGVGFLCGYTLSCMLLLALCIMPCSRGQIDRLCTRDNLCKVSVPGVEKACNFLGWYSLHCFDGNVEHAIEHLLTLNDPKEEEVVPVLLPKEMTVPVRSSNPTEAAPAAASSEQSTAGSPLPEKDS